MAKDFVGGMLSPLTCAGQVLEIKDFPANGGKKPWASVTIIFDEEGYSGGTFRRYVKAKFFGTMAEAVCDPKTGLKVGECVTVCGTLDVGAYIPKKQEQDKEKKPVGTIEIGVKSWSRMGAGGGATTSARDETTVAPTEVEDEPNAEHDPFSDDE